MNNKFIKFGVCLVAAGVIFLSILLGNHIGEAGVNYMQSQMEKNAEREGLVLKNKSASSQLSNVVIIKSVPTKKPVSNACIAAAKLSVSSSYPSSSLEFIYTAPAYVTEIHSNEHDLCVVSAEVKEKTAPASDQNSMTINMVGEFNNTSKITELVYLDYNATKAASGAFEKAYHKTHQDDAPVSVRVYMYDEVRVDQPRTPHSKLTSGAQKGQVIIDIKPISATANSLTFTGFIGQQKCHVTIESNKKNTQSPFAQRDWSLNNNMIECHN